MFLNEIISSCAVPSISAVLESYRERDTGSEFSVELRFRCSGSDCSPRDNCVYKEHEAVSERIFESDKT
jgi:hypothetical protein